MPAFASAHLHHHRLRMNVLQNAKSRRRLRMNAKSRRRLRMNACVCVCPSPPAHECLRLPSPPAFLLELFKRMFHGLFALVHAHLAQEVGGLSLCLHPAPSSGASGQSPQKIKKMYFARLALSLRLALSSRSGRS